MHGAVAQLGEHLLCKQGVIGSIPISSTKSLIRCFQIGAASTGLNLEAGLIRLWR